MIRRPPRSTLDRSSAASDVYKRQNLVCGGGIQVGNKFTRCMGNHGTPDIKTAIIHSCDGYFYRLGLKMGIDGIVSMVDEFDLNKRTGIDLPNEVVSWTPSREFKRRMQPVSYTHLRAHETGRNLVCR